MGRAAMGGDPDPEAVTTPEGIRDAIGELMGRRRIGTRETSRRAGVSYGAISGWTSGTFPSESAFEAFITRACHVEWEPWRRARERADQSRKAAREGGSYAALSERVALLEGEIRELKGAYAQGKGRLATASATPAEEHRKTRREGLDFLNAVGWADLSSRHWEAGTTYQKGPVDAFLKDVRIAATTDLDELHTKMLTHPGTFPVIDEQDKEIWGYAQGDVDDYVVRLRRALEERAKHARNGSASLSDSLSVTVDAASWAPSPRAREGVDGPFEEQVWWERDKRPRDGRQ